MYYVLHTTNENIQMLDLYNKNHKLSILTIQQKNSRILDRKHIEVKNAYPSCLSLDKIESFPFDALELEGSTARALSNDCMASSYLCK